MKNRTDLILGEAFCIFIFFYFVDSGLSLLNGLQFCFRLRDSENREYFTNHVVTRDIILPGPVLERILPNKDGLAVRNINNSKAEVFFASFLFI